VEEAPMEDAPVLAPDAAEIILHLGNTLISVVLVSNLEFDLFLVVQSQESSFDLFYRLVQLQINITEAPYLFYRLVGEVLK
jgi:hypothetical protein